MSCFSAASRMVRLSRNTWSAQHQRIAVAQVDLHLRRALLVDQGVDLQLLRLGEGVDVLEQGVELVDRRDRIGAAAGFGPARAADRRFERIVRIGVALDQVEFELRRHDRLPALLAIEIDHPLQHLARGDLDGAAVVIDGVVDHLGGRVAAPTAPRTGSRSPAAVRCRRRTDRSGSPRSPRGIRRRWSA